MIRRWWFSRWCVLSEQEAGKACEERCACPLLRSLRPRIWCFLIGDCIMMCFEVECARFESGKLSRWLENRKRWLQHLMSGEEPMRLNLEFLG